MFNFVYNLNRYGKNFLGSKRQLQDGSRICDSQSAATPSKSKWEIRQILKQESKIRGEYLLHKPVCAIVGGEAWSTQANQLERKMTGHAVVLIIQAGHIGLEFIQLDPQGIKEAKVREKVTEMAKEFKVNELNLISGSSDETSTECVLACYKVELFIKNQVASIDLISRFFISHVFLDDAQAYIAGCWYTNVRGYCACTTLTPPIFT